MKKESFFERIIRPTVLTLKMLIPPFYSFRRLEKSCKTWFDRNPEAAYPRSFLADLYRFYEKNQEAKKEYTQLKHSGSATDSDILGLGEVLFRLEDYEGVIETLSPIIDKYPKHKNANWYLGMSYVKKEEYQKAAVYFERLIASGSRRHEDYWHLGYCYSRIGDLEKARMSFEKALSSKPDSKELRETLASLHIRIGQSHLGEDLDGSDLEEAEVEFEKALEINPGNPDAVRLLANIQEMKNAVKKIKELRQIKENHT